MNITIDPSNIGAFLTALKPVYEALVSEPNCTYFEVFHSLEEPGAFRFVENWDQTKEWFLEVRRRTLESNTYYSVLQFNNFLP